LRRKIAEAVPGGEIEIWGDGKQTPMFLCMDECLEGVRRLMESNLVGPVNICSDGIVSIHRPVEIVCGVAGRASSSDTSTVLSGAVVVRRTTG
jgi:nucleoside-diphosphate-sugar epimerase